MLAILNGASMDEEKPAVGAKIADMLCCFGYSRKPNRLTMQSRLIRDGFWLGRGKGLAGFFPGLLKEFWVKHDYGPSEKRRQSVGEWQ